jgi:hypothetical protein
MIRRDVLGKPLYRQVPVVYPGSIDAAANLRIYLICEMLGWHAAAWFHELGTVAYCSCEG